MNGSFPLVLVLGYALMSLAASLAEPIPVDQPRARILDESVIVCDGYCGWPTVCRRRNGELLVVYSGDRKAHVDPWGKVRLIRSTDDGHTWSTPVTICNTLWTTVIAGYLKRRPVRLSCSGSIRSLGGVAT